MNFSISLKKTFKVCKQIKRNFILTSFPCESHNESIFTFSGITSGLIALGTLCVDGGYAMQIVYLNSFTCHTQLQVCVARGTAERKHSIHSYFRVLICHFNAAGTAWPRLRLVSRSAPFHSCATHTQAAS